MNIRTIKLREGPKSALGHLSFCSVLWDHQGRHLLTASSSDQNIYVHDPLFLSSAPRVLSYHRDGVTALSLNHKSTCLASGSIDRSVKLYKFPGGEFQANISRFTLPIRTVAFNKSGSMLGAAGDDEGIKLINIFDGSVVRILKEHRFSISCVAFDPKGEYLASVDSIGTVIFWELHSGAVIHTLKDIAPVVGSDTSYLNIVSWSPDGETLAVPGLKHDVVMYDRDTAERLFSLQGGHTETICFLSWSPNGKYMATSGLDKQILIWDVGQKLDINHHRFGSRISSLVWKPFGNALAVIDAMGNYGLWESVVPPSMKSPTEDISDSNASDSPILHKEDNEVVSTSGSFSNDEVDFDKLVSQSRKRLRRNSELDESADEDIHAPRNLKKKIVSSTGINHNENHLKPALMSKMQVAFQPGSTPRQPGKRHFLCYNMLGAISSLDQDGSFHIEIDFHDTGSGPRIPSMTDHFGFTVASLNEGGCVFANPCKGEKNMSTILYRPFSSWASNSEWSMRFEGEETKVVALGNSWVAAITNLNLLRIYTEGGLQRLILSLDGPVVTASGYKNQLAVVFHVSDCFPSNDQVLEFRVFDVSGGTQMYRGHLPLTPGSHLKWLGFSEDGQLSSYDSRGYLRIYLSQYGGCWIPAFSVREQETDEVHWLVGLNATKIFCIKCKAPDSFPQVEPKPVLTLLDFSFPLASSDIGADALENEFIVNEMHLSQIRKKIEETLQSGYDATELEDEAFNVEAAQDRCILRLIASCCNADKFVRATELVKLLSLEKSVKGAIKLVTALKHPSLAERFNSILEERMLGNSKQSDDDVSKRLPNTKLHHLERTETVRSTDIPTSGATPDTSKPSFPATSKLSAPLLIKKHKNRLEQDSSVADKVVAESVKTLSKKGDDSQPRPKFPAKPFKLQPK